MELISIIIAAAALLASIGSTIWIGGFKFAEVMHEIKYLRVDMHKMEERIEKRFEKVEHRLERIEENIHNLDIRVTALEIRVTAIEQKVK